MKNYETYTNYYINSFLPEFEKASLIKNSLNSSSVYTKKEICEFFVLIFEISYFLLKYYLLNNGLFKFNETDVIREAFRIELLNDGEEWMEVLKLVQQLQQDAMSDKFYPKVAEYFISYFYIYENLNDKFRKLVHNVISSQI